MNEPSGISQLVNLTCLGMFTGGAAVYDLNSLTNLSTLHVSQTYLELSSLPDSLVSLSHVDTLFPADSIYRLQKLTNLTELSAEIEETPEIYEIFTPLTKLVDLRLRFEGGVIDLPHLPNLQKLDLSGPDMVKITIGISRLTNLTSLSLLVVDNLGWLSALTKLRTLNLPEEPKFKLEEWMVWKLVPKLTEFSFI
jgi:Leucine-rich repeat (LRR) protein